LRAILDWLDAKGAGATGVACHVAMAIDSFGDTAVIAEREAPGAVEAVLSEIHPVAGE
jgi:hypothetical protein